jgi:nucleotide-binding universal stress UspA family protein
MSAMRSLLVHLDGGPHGASRLQAARALGDLLGADVTALYAVVPACLEMSLLFTAGLANQALLDLDETRLENARRLVNSASAAADVPIHWRQALEGPEHALARQAMYADLLVLGQNDSGHGDTGVPSDFVEAVLIDSGKPALVVPYISAREPRFGSVFVAWKENRECARALAAALPILRTAHTVEVAVDAASGTYSDLLPEYLQSHGVQARYHTIAADAGAQAGERMLSMAADLNADLMVMGCYGHSRGRELVLGGASRTVLQSMTLPVLMSH